MRLSTSSQSTLSRFEPPILLTNTQDTLVNWKLYSTSHFLPRFRMRNVPWFSSVKFKKQNTMSKTGRYWYMYHSLYQKHPKWVKDSKWERNKLVRAWIENMRQIFPAQGSNPGLLRCRWILYQLSYEGSPSQRKNIKN